MFGLSRDRKLTERKVGGGRRWGPVRVRGNWKATSNSIYMYTCVKHKPIMTVVVIL